MSTGMTAVSLYRHLMRTVKKLPKEAQPHYKHFVRQSYNSHSDESDPERVREIIERALSDSEWVLNKCVRASACCSAMSGVWDVVVVGAGVEGSATAHYLAKAGYRTLLLEQFPLPHTRGSSHGQSRIIRRAYNEPFYSDMMREAYSSWESLEKETGTTLYTKTGLLVIDDTGAASLRNIEQALMSTQSVYQLLDSGQLARQYPMLTNSGHMAGVLDPMGGVLAADRAVRALQSAFVKLGGVLRDGEPVTKITPGNIVTVTTPQDSYRARSIVLAAGPWTNKLCKQLNLQLPLKTRHIGVWYWRVKSGQQPMPHCLIFNESSSIHGYLLPTKEYPDMVKVKLIGVYHWRVRAGGVASGWPMMSRFPAHDSSQGIYCCPSVEQPNMVKVCSHMGPVVDPDQRDQASPTQEINRVKSFIEKHLPCLENKPSVVESCMYTMTPDENFILDSHPHWKNIVIGAGFSGHGFKLAPVVGRILGQLATGQPPSYDLTPFTINRFSPSKTASKL